MGIPEPAWDGDGEGKSYLCPIIMPTLKSKLSNNKQIFIRSKTRMN